MATDNSLPKLRNKSFIRDRLESISHFQVRAINEISKLNATVVDCTITDDILAILYYDTTELNEKG